ncbi:RWD domain-containing protein 1, partial [Halocaridina rubra]
MFTFVHVTEINLFTMTDYKEEQTNEIEALESIYPEEFEILETEPHHKFKITVKSEESEPYAVMPIEAAEIILNFEYTSTYPDEPPVMEVIPVDNIEDEDLEELRMQLQEQCQENLGMVMVFTLVSYSLEWLTNHMEKIARMAKEELERKKLELEELER